MQISFLRKYARALFALGPLGLDGACMHGMMNGMMNGWIAIRIIIVSTSHLNKQVGIYSYSPLSRMWLKQRLLIKFREKRNECQQRLAKAKILNGNNSANSKRNQGIMEMKRPDVMTHIRWPPSQRICAAFNVSVLVVSMVWLKPI